MLAPSRPVGISNRTKATVQVNVCLPRSYSRRAQAQHPSVLLMALGCPARLWAGMDLARLVNVLRLRLPAEQLPLLRSFLDVPALGQAPPQLLRRFPVRACLAVKTMIRGPGRAMRSAHSQTLNATGPGTVLIAGSGRSSSLTLIDEKVCVV
jgi:hypothetical protein